MNEVKAMIWEHILSVRAKNPEQFNPLTMSKLRTVLSTDITEIVIRVAQLPDASKRPLVQDTFFASKAKGLKFGIETMKANDKHNLEIVGLVRETHGFTITEEEIETALESPEEFLKSKMGSPDDKILEMYIDGLIKIHAMFNHNEQAFQINPSAYVLSSLMIDNALSEISTPISKIANDYSFLHEFYAPKPINRLIHPQFSSYSLLTIREGLEFGEIAPPRLYDSTNDSTIMLCGVEDFTYNYLRKLRSNYQFDLSLKPSSLYFSPGKITIMRVQEHLETGELFNKLNLDASLISKLYDDYYQTLWVNVKVNANPATDPNSITFEELRNNEHVDAEDNFVTQVVHCEYFKDGDSYYISHLDHEFIFYSLDEYEKRQSNPYQKGNAKKRIKTFKIDNGKIPLTGSTVLFDILQMKFHHQELILEYFGKIM